MFRAFAIAAILASAASTAQAEDTLATRIHDAAVKVCVAKVGGSLPLSYYGALTAHCVDRVSAYAMATIRAQQTASAK